MSKKVFKPPEFPKFVDILGTPYQIFIKKYKEDPYFEKNSAAGYCDEVQKILCVCDMSTWPAFPEESDRFYREDMKHSLRHEIVHAYLSESGLRDSALNYSNGWAKNEEMVDWFAVQGEKIYKTWTEVGALSAIMTPEEWVEWKKFETGRKKDI